MTNERKPPKGKYRQIYYKRNRLKPYTSAFVGEDDYLQTAVWLELRNERLKIDHYCCQHCGTAINPEVHHLKYPDVWGTENVEEDLITLCATCHAETHKNDIVNNNRSQDQEIIF